MLPLVLSLASMICALFLAYELSRYNGPGLRFQPIYTGLIASVVVDVLHLLLQAPVSGLGPHRSWVPASVALLLCFAVSRGSARFAVVPALAMAASVLVGVGANAERSAWLFSGRGDPADLLLATLWAWIAARTARDVVRAGPVTAIPVSMALAHLVATASATPEDHLFAAAIAVKICGQFLALAALTGLHPTSRKKRRLA